MIIIIFIVLAVFFVGALYKLARYLAQSNFKFWLISKFQRPFNGPEKYQAISKVESLYADFGLEAMEMECVPVFFRPARQGNYGECMAPDIFFRDGVIFIYRKEELEATLIHEYLHSQTVNFSKYTAFWDEVFIQILERYCLDPRPNKYPPENEEQEALYSICEIIAKAKNDEPDNILVAMTKMLLQDDIDAFEEYIDSHFGKGAFKCFDGEEMNGANADFPALIKKLESGACYGLF